jgi:hypothetical protein
MQEVKSRPIGTIALAVGVVAILLAVLADPLGIGGKEDTFGWKQIVLLVVGVLVAGGGLAIMTGLLGQAVRESVEEPESGRQEPPMPPPE